MNKLKTLRKLHKINQTEMAKVLNTNQNQYSRYERGERELRESQIVTICKHFKITADYLLGIDEETPMDQRPQAFKAYKI